MGASGSVVDVNAMDMNAVDVDTPRGVSAKEEVRRLRSLLLERSQQTIELLARARFSELDKDSNGFLENDELVTVVDWVLSSFGDRLGTDSEQLRAKMMAKLDRNKDGKLDCGEFEVLFKEMLNRSLLIERARLKFVELDANKSGTLEHDEIKGVLEWTLQAYPVGDMDTYTHHLLQSVDINKDGVLDLLEFTNLFEAMLQRVDLMEKARSKFNELDVDCSGHIEKDELDAMVAWVLDTYGEMPTDQRTTFRKRLMDKIDVNKDGSVDLQEFTTLFGEVLDRMEMIALARAKFEQLDSNNSGYLEKTELKGVVQDWAVSYGKICGDENSTALLDELICTLDVDKDGKVSFGEFIVLFENFLLAKKNLSVRNVTAEVEIAPTIFDTPAA